ncbi:hypothetical protein DTO164E3_7760 [Paecilomyces variotii]|nr:hypothetical protein DTO164E3_7760 [Paecilomyces variotii]KAJ9266122.1 hypothetical protein DTO195F2_1237 [Paecilomyces variotii]KAJ9321811.1 hypothetical protein DTO027B3_7201 [Paecilomyces variotii]KAJ9329491.1 hypothetical protein DTO027B5_8335 [Paecilomyces variotii]KAJ9366989.1 hypothetical protein DTO282E5_8304 [Paecilomyces variotii]
MAIPQASGSGPAAAREGGQRSHSQLDPTLKHFADPSFDPVDLINDALPPLTLALSQPHATRAPGSVPLSELSSQTQSLLSQWSAQNVRLSNILTQLTDEILRSSGRLAYEVEVLRGEALGLSDALTESLHGDIQKFVPEGLAENLAQTDVTQGATNTTDLPEAEDDQVKQKQTAVSDPEYIIKLRTLGQVRSRLEDVVHLFGEAMEWPLPPSELSIASSFISVSAPEPPGWESHSQEEKGQEIARKLRAEITELLDSDGGGEAGLEAARKRVETMRELATVWKGSVEERARNRFVDGLENMVDDRRRVLERQLKERERRSDELRRQRSQKKNRSSMDQSDSGGPAGGLFRNLQRLRDEIYLD